MTVGINKHSPSQSPILGLGCSESRSDLGHICIQVNLIGLEMHFMDLVVSPNGLRDIVWSDFWLTGWSISVVINIVGKFDRNSNLFWTP